MTDERPTIRPVTLSRLAELTHACDTEPVTTEQLESDLDVSHRRARETILEATRIGLLQETEIDDDQVYATSTIGGDFLAAILAEDWYRVSTILESNSPHFAAFLDVVGDIAPANITTVLERLEETQQDTPYTYNQTSIDVMADWAERLGCVQRNAFTGRYYRPSPAGELSDFSTTLLDAYDNLEQTAGVNLRQRYLSIPQLRETICERVRCARNEFDRTLIELCQQNVGKLELSGAPIDTAAKDAALGIKQIELADDDALVSTSQSSQQVMAGVELYDKQYYYLAVHDRELTFETEAQ
ncbi:hypothetical protein [Haladaptatus sp. AB643]|uniref:hypothetical protein n=1 Tax=Haladaptatus sp. AB643 TaxID=2934174 RepID=UPI00209BD1F7|nr:hypothetical protein [Haladaptatus sp. AB643]MCO8242983.1 hypothetical protein [Haladaptatus sp. AB643]